MAPRRAESSRPLGIASTWARIAASFAVVSSVSVVYLSLSLLLLPWRPLRIRIGNVYGKTVGRPVARILGVRTRVRHRARLAESRPAIYVTNHTSALDVFIGMWLCPMGGCGIAKKEIARIPFFGWAYRLSGHLLIDRGDREGAIAALEATAEVVRRNHLSIWIWPEGTRSRTGQMAPFKAGVGLLARFTRRPVVPVYVEGGPSVLPCRAFLPRPGRMVVRYGSPLRYRPGETPGGFAARLQDAVRGLEGRSDRDLRVVS
ncbi:MAG: 1-acyl-sn-glycerol-3-phosphate acyltransferase [Gemmatimonadetes bacterium]|nr:1-acyl-sn-glycerol-3-phosphate acyltransferase [Gemmatimonadota bacterium]